MEEESVEDMATNIGKWLALTIMAFVVAFLALAFFKEGFLELFGNWTLKIIYAVVGGTVIYVIVNLTIGKKRR